MHTQSRPRTLQSLKACTWPRHSNPCPHTRTQPRTQPYTQQTAPKSTLVQSLSHACAPPANTHLPHVLTLGHVCVAKHTCVRHMSLRSGHVRERLSLTSHVKACKRMSHTHSHTYANARKHTHTYTSARMLHAHAHTHTHTRVHESKGWNCSFGSHFGIVILSVCT